MDPIYLFLGNFHTFAFSVGHTSKIVKLVKTTSRFKVLHSKIVLCVEFDRNQMIFISLYFLWSYLTSMQKQTSDANSAPQNCTKYQIS